MADPNRPSREESDQSTSCTANVDEIESRPRRAEYLWTVKLMSRTRANFVPVSSFMAVARMLSQFATCDVAGQPTTSSAEMFNALLSWAIFGTRQGLIRRKRYDDLVWEQISRAHRLESKDWCRSRRAGINIIATKRILTQNFVPWFRCDQSTYSRMGHLPLTCFRFMFSSGEAEIEVSEQILWSMSYCHRQIGTFSSLTKICLTSKLWSSHKVLECTSWFYSYH